MIQKLFLPVLTVLLIQSCSIGTSETWKDENIDDKKREQIKVLNDKLFRALANNDVASLKTLASDKLNQKGDDLNKILILVGTSLKGKTYRILDEYYLRNLTTGLDNAIPFGISGDNDFVINYTALNKEMYVSLLLSSGLDDEELIIAIYGNYNGEWKLNILQVGQYSLYKKNLPDYFKVAQAYYDKSNLVDAYINLNFSEYRLKPTSNFFKYQKAAEMDELFDKVRNELNSKFPLPFTLENIKTKPKIFRISPETTENGLFPMVQYLTDINLKDTIALKKENEMVKKEIGRLFTGIDKNNEYIYYQVFNEIPKGKQLEEHHEFIEQLTN